MSDEQGEPREPPDVVPGGEVSERVSVWQTLIGCTYSLLFVAVCIGFYFGALRLYGLVPHSDVGVWHWVGGSVVTLFTVTTISFVGESLTEDIVKFLLLGGVGGFAARGMEPGAASLWLGIVAGSFIPVAFRIGSRLTGREGNASRGA